MNIDDSVFAIKLYEMEEQYGKLQCRIRSVNRAAEIRFIPSFRKPGKSIKKTHCCWRKKQNLPFSGCDQTDTGAAGLQKEDRRVHEETDCQGSAHLGQQFPGR